MEKCCIWTWVIISLIVSISESHGEKLNNTELNRLNLDVCQPIAITLWTAKYTYFFQYLKTITWFSKEVAHVLSPKNDIKLSKIFHITSIFLCFSLNISLIVNKTINQHSCWSYTHSSIATISCICYKSLSKANESILCKSISYMKVIIRNIEYFIIIICKFCAT